MNTADMDPRLSALGDALELAAAADLRSSTSHLPQASVAAGSSLGRHRRRRRIMAVALTAGILLPAGALAADQLLSTGEVAAGLPAGTQALIGTNPKCTVVQAGVEYRCTLAGPPSAYGGPAPGEWLGTVEATVDASKHVDGGCRSLDEAGETWECYMGQAAVTQAIIGQSFLGQYAPSPGVG